MMHILGDPVFKPPIVQRGVDVIQKMVVEKDKRSAISRLFHARKKKVMVTAWRIRPLYDLRIFNVRSVNPLRPSLTVRLQAELATTTLGVISYECTTIPFRNCLKKASRKGIEQNVGRVVKATLRYRAGRLKNVDGTHPQTEGRGETDNPFIGGQQRISEAVGVVG